MLFSNPKSAEHLYVHLMHVLNMDIVDSIKSDSMTKFNEVNSKVIK